MPLIPVSLITILPCSQSDEEEEEEEEKEKGWMLPEFLKRDTQFANAPNRA
jgi:hypothetical protein